MCVKSVELVLKARNLKMSALTVVGQCETQLSLTTNPREASRLDSKEVHGEFFCRPVRRCIAKPLEPRLSVMMPNITHVCKFTVRTASRLLVKQRRMEHAVIECRPHTF